MENWGKAHGGMIFCTGVGSLMNRSERNGAAIMNIRLMFSLFPFFFFFSPSFFFLFSSLSSHRTLASVTELPLIECHGAICRVVSQLAGPGGITLLVQGYAA